MANIRGNLAKRTTLGETVLFLCFAVRARPPTEAHTEAQGGRGSGSLCWRGCRGARVCVCLCVFVFARAPAHRGAQRGAGRQGLRISLLTRARVTTRARA